jgi:hypothetical protein
MEADAHGYEGAEAAAMFLQQEVLTFVRDNSTEFKSSTAKQYLDSMPDEVGGQAYAH